MKPIGGPAHASTYPEGAVIATRPAMAPLATMPMSIVRCFSSVTTNAPRMPPAQPSIVTTATSAKRASPIAERRARR